MGSAVRTGLGVAAAGGLIARAASYAGVPILASMASVMPYFSNHPARVIAGVTIADSLRHRVVAPLQKQHRMLQIPRVVLRRDQPHAGSRAPLYLMLQTGT